MPVEEHVPIIEVSPATGKENLRTKTTQRWGRSPHPYRRRKETIPDRTFISERPGNQDSTISPRTRINDEETSTSKSDAVSRWQNKTSPSESGTEADDESGVVLKGLPAPPIRWRKGLRDAEGKEESSPLLTPSYLDDDEKRLAIERQFRRLSNAQSPLLTDEETLKIRDKFIQRRRAELLRRISETVIVSFVGYVACYNSVELLGSTWTLGNWDSSQAQTRLLITLQFCIAICAWCLEFMYLILSGSSIAIYSQLPTRNALGSFYAYQRPLTLLLYCIQFLFRYLLQCPSRPRNPESYYPISCSAFLPFRAPCYQSMTISRDIARFSGFLLWSHC